MSVSAEYLREWRKNHPDNIRANRQTYWQRHKDEINAARRQRARTEDDPDRAAQKSAKAKAYRDAHKAEHVAYMREWQRAHKDKVRAYQQKCRGKVKAEPRPEPVVVVRPPVIRERPVRPKILRTQKEVPHKRPGIPMWKEIPLPPAIQKRIDMIVAAEMTRRLA